MKTLMMAIMVVGMVMGCTTGNLPPRSKTEIAAKRYEVCGIDSNRGAQAAAKMAGWNVSNCYYFNLDKDYLMVRMKEEGVYFASAISNDVAIASAEVRRAEGESLADLYFRLFTTLRENLEGYTPSGLAEEEEVKQ